MYFNNIIPPSPDFACKEPNYAFRSNAFDENEINRIIEIGEYAYRLEQARVGTGTGENGTCNMQVRNSKVSWLPHDTDTHFIYERVSRIVSELNGQFFQMDIHGFFELMQFTVYNGAPLDEAGSSGHYDWHIDKGFNGLPPRKMSAVIQLSDPSEYDGGNLEIMTSSQPERMIKAKGFLCMFPSYALHRVTPVTAGIRKSLVVWLTGPKFR
jgi:PKHD-type hydroxylase